MTLLCAMQFCDFVATTKKVNHRVGKGDPQLGPWQGGYAE
jgi:hypothetical protein